MPRQLEAANRTGLGTLAQSCTVGVGRGLGGLANGAAGQQIALAVGGDTTCSMRVQEPL